MVKSTGGALALVIGLALLASAKGGNALNAAYLVPGGSIKLDRQAIAAHKFCALTFDDGPDKTYTPQVAAVLDRYGVPATFFVVGSRVSSYPEQVRALSHAGHEIGNHSWSHPDFTTLTPAQRKSELARTQVALEKIGITPRWFRPPYGAFNKSVVKSCQGCGLKPVLWSVDPLDWQRPGAQKIENRVLSGTGNGGVVLLHSTNAQTVEALPGIIEKLRARGYTFVTMSQWERAASGGPLPSAQPQPLVSPSGEPPSFRQLEQLPEPPAVPGSGPGLLAVAESAADSAQAADPVWVEAVAPEFAAPTVAELLAAAEVPQAAPVTPEPAAMPEPAAEPAPVAKAQLPEPKLPLFIYGNFAGNVDAERILSGRSAGQTQRR